MKRNLILSVLASAIIFVSCSKEKTENYPGATSTKKLVQTSLLKNGTVSYYPDGKLKQISHDQGSYHYDKKFTYSPGKVSYEWIQDGTKLSENGEYTLVNGKISTFVWTYYDAYGAPIKTFHESYTYNGKGLIEKHIYDNGAYWQYQYDMNDNMVVSVFYNENGEATDKSEYEYGTEKDLFTSLGFFTYYGEGFFLPAFSKYLLKHAKYTNLLTGEVTYEGNLNYELDSNGFVQKAKWTTITGSGGGYEWMNSFQ